MSQGLLFQPRPAIQEPASADPWQGARYYQREACHSVWEGFGEHRSQLLVMATGTGKTFVFSALARRWIAEGRGNVLVLANRNELVQQGAKHLERVCGVACEIDQADELASRKAQLVMASIDTIKQQHRLDRYGKDHFSLVIADECFPAGTLIDGVPIERVSHGDLVTCVDHATGEICRRRVTERFSSLAGCTHTLYSGATSLECTANHPVYIKRGENYGYLQASRVVPGDMLCMWCSDSKGASAFSEGAENLLQEVRRCTLISEDGSDQPPLCFKKDDGAEPDASGLCAGKDVGHAEIYGSRSEYPPREWTWAYGSGAGGGKRAWLENQRRGAHSHAGRIGIPDQLQVGRGERGIKDWRGSGWRKPLGEGTTGPRREERKVLAWARVDRVARNEPSGPGGTRVYNLEVEGCHTYFANDALVHNCHHFVGNTYTKPFDFFAAAKVVGVTATPDRADEKALGKQFESVAYCFDILQGIEAGYLVPIAGKQIELGEIQLDGIKDVAGDLAKGQLDEVMVRAVEGIVSKTLELERERQAIGFFPGIKSAEYAAERFNALEPNSTGFIHGGTDPSLRNQITADYKSGKLRRLMNVGIAIEGFDAPATSLIIQGRPTKSRMFYAQTVGRGTRVLPGTVDHLDGAERSAERRAAVAASLKPSCIAEGQRVLTDSGLVPIEQVTRSMRVWDGCNFVSHGGTVLRGKRTVIQYAGLRATPDHRVWTQEGWQTFGECAAKQIPIRVTGLGGAHVWEADGRVRGGCAEEKGWHASLIGRMHRVQRAITKGSLYPGARDRGVPFLRESASYSEVAVSKVQLGKDALHKFTRRALSGLRHAWDRISVRLSTGNGVMGGAGAWFAPGTSDRPHRKRWTLRARQSSLVVSVSEHLPYSPQNAKCASPQVSPGASGNQVCRCDAAAPGREIHVRGNRGAISSAFEQAEGRVWDILDCGPLHRFTVEGLLVHNCLVLDFVGNATKHALITPEDLLGGDYSDEEVEEAKRKGKESPGGDVRARLEEARKELARVAAAVRSKVSASVRSFNPFAVLDVDLTSTTREDMRWGRLPATESQKEALGKMKVPPAAIASISEREARKLLMERNRRHDAGLATYAQLAQLKRYGLDDKSVSFKNAGRALTYVAQECNWNASKVNIGQLSWLASGGKQ